MKTAAQVPALLLLAALLPACGGGGGGGAVSIGPIELPGVVASLPLDTSAATVTINTAGQLDSVVQTLLQTALNSNNKIVMHNNGSARTVVLSATLNVPSNVGSPRTIVLDGSGDITLSGNTAQRILDLNDLTRLSVQRMGFIDARSTQNGAAINSLSRVREVAIINCSFDNCQTTQTGPDRGGGAIRLWNGAHTEISGSTFNNCRGSNGGAVNSLGTRLTIINSTFTSNMAFGTGGGADVGLTGQGGIGGAVYVDNVSNDAGALHQLSITGCTFASNTANDHAGAVFGYTNPAAPSTSIYDRCTFTSNSVAGGGGHSGAIYTQAGTMTLSNSTFTGNQAAGSGGCIFVNNDSALIASCTFQGNTAVANLGGAVFAPSGRLTVVNCTFAQNSAGDFAGALFSAAGSTSVYNCIFSQNTPGANVFAGNQVNASFAGGGNVQAPDSPLPGGKSATSTGTTRVASAMLGSLQNNGGPTFTMRPQAGSAAINLADVSALAPTLDQRGLGRNGAPDAGACEGP